VFNLLGGSAVVASQLGVAGAESAANVVPFATRPGSGARLTLGDRMDATMWQENARRHGYDRLIVHERSPDDAPEVESFISLYRRGEHWARWGIARSGSSVLAWCSLSGADVGRFASVADALSTLLPRGGHVVPNRVGGEVVRAFG
jgi:hypothetical protein